MEVLQVDAELDQMRDLYRERNPKRVLEIGSWDGGTLREWLAGEPDLVVAIDDNHRNESAYEDWLVPGTELILGKGLSQSLEMVELMEEFAPYDWVFIDGDHDAGAVALDVLNCKRLTEGVLALHDIVPGDGLPTTGPQIAFNKLRRKHKTTKFVADPGAWPWAHGIGVVFL